MPRPTFSAIDLIVQIARFAEDGSRRLTRITEVLGLDENNQFQTQDLFVSKLRGKTKSGALLAEFVPTGTLPSFAREVYEHGIGDMVNFSKKLWSR